MFPEYNLDSLISRAKARLATAGLDTGRLNVYNLIKRLRREELRAARRADFDTTVMTEPQTTRETTHDTDTRTPRPPAVAQAGF